MMFQWFKCILLTRTETICWTIRKRGMMWRFGFRKWFSTSNQNNNVLTTVKEIKYFLVKNAGKQCVTMSLTAVICHHLEDINFWTSSTLNNICTIGNNLYMYISIRCSVQTKDYLLLSDIPCIIAISNKLYTYEWTLTGSLTSSWHQIII